MSKKSPTPIHSKQFVLTPLEISVLIDTTKLVLDICSLDVLCDNYSNSIQKFLFKQTNEKVSCLSDLNKLLTTLNLP